MNVKSIEKNENKSASIVVTVDAAEFNDAVNEVYKKNKSLISVPGFRKGKAPRKLIENTYGADIFNNDAFDSLYTKAVDFAVEQEGLRTVGKPIITESKVEDDRSATIGFIVDLYPEVTMGQYRGVKAFKGKVEVTEEDIAHELEHIVEQNARMQPVEREAKMGDTVNIDFEGFLNGEPFEGGKGEGHDLELGSDSFVPGFEEQVVGMKAGEEKDIDITFPEDYVEDLAGKDVVFKVKANEVKEKILPELDDEFAKDVSEFDTLEEYKESLRGTIEQRKQADVDRSFKQAVMKEVTYQMKVDVPPSMIEEHLDGVLQNYQDAIANQGMSFSDYLQMLGTNLEEFRNMMRPGSEETIMGNLALEKIAEIENIEATEEEVQKEYERIAAANGVDLEIVKKYVQEDGIISQIKLTKAENIIYDTAIPTDGPVHEEKSEEQEEKAQEQEDKAEE